MEAGGWPLAAGRALGKWPHSLGRESCRAGSNLGSQGSGREGLPGSPVDGWGGEAHGDTKVRV